MDVKLGTWKWATEEARQIQLEVPAKDPWHWLEQLNTKQLNTKQRGQEAVKMPASIINYLQWCLNWLGHVCRLLPSWPTNHVLHCVPPGQRRWRRQNQRWTANIILTRTCNLSTATGTMCSSLPRTEESGVLWLPHVTQDTAAAKTKTRWCTNVLTDELSKQAASYWEALSDLRFVQGTTCPFNGWYHVAILLKKDWVLLHLYNYTTPFLQCKCISSKRQPHSPLFRKETNQIHVC